MLLQDEFVILDYLDAFKVAQESIIKEDLASMDNISKLLTELADRELVSKTPEGSWAIRQKGEAEIGENRKLLLERCASKEEFLRLCSQFEVLNFEFKTLVTKWQIREFQGSSTQNDHKDSEYDFSIVEQLANVHEKTKNMISQISVIFPFYKRFLDRFQNSFQHIANGEFDFIDISRDSYHNIWFEIHESLLQLSGTKRIE